MARFQRRIRRSRTGEFELRLPRAERDVLRSLPRQLREILSSDDPALERLFPDAYAGDSEMSEEFRQMVRGDLMSRRLSAIEVMESTIDSEKLNEEELSSWLGALNDIRLVLGSRLQVTEDLDPDEIPDDDPRASVFALYYYLTWLEEQVVEELASGIAPEGSGR